MANVNDNKQAIIIMPFQSGGSMSTVYFTAESFKLKPVWSAMRKDALVMAHGFATFLMTHPKAKAQKWVMVEV